LRSSGPGSARDRPIFGVTGVPATQTGTAWTPCPGSGTSVTVEVDAHHIPATAESTGGAFSIIEEINPVNAPMHLHERHDELFYVLEGDHVFTVGDIEHEAGPGDLVFGPRGVPHAQRRVIPRTGRILTMFSPAGFEGFFRDLAEAGRLGDDGPEALTRIAARYGAVWVC
jgi:mannose-6-phosphate isomerase-like protein (cupin superfamily)